MIQVSSFITVAVLPNLAAFKMPSVVFKFPSHVDVVVLGTADDDVVEMGKEISAPDWSPPPQEVGGTLIRCSDWS